MSRQNLILTMGAAGLLLLVSVSAFAAYYGTGATVSGYGTCSNGLDQCPPPTYVRPIYDGTDFYYGLSHSYDSSGLYSNIGTGSIYHPSNINGTITYPASGVIPPFTAPDIVVDGTGGSSGSGSHGSWSTGGHSIAAAGLGHLHAYATAVADLFPVDQTTAAEAAASAQASWYDTLTITSSTLNPGTPVLLRGTLRLDGHLSITDPLGLQTQASPMSDLAFSQMVLSWQSSQTGLDDTYCAVSVDRYGSWLPPCSSEFTIYTTVGDTIIIRGRLDTSAYVNAGRNLVNYYDNNPHGPFPGSRATADFYNTGFITLESTTAGASFTTDSGASYSIVPVPAAVWLFVSGFLGLMGIARRKAPAA